jgi:YHS domain-containing protein
MKLILAIFLTMFVVSCAHHHKSPKHHHHAYDKNCAYSVSHGDLKTEGSSEYKIEHGGKTYYFSTKENLNKFKKDIEASIKRANQNWLDRGGRL